MASTQTLSKTSTKASRLQQLSEIVSVPAFSVITRDDSFDPAGYTGDYTTGNPSHRYMVRSSSAAEDQADHSHAGQSLTLGPVPPGEGMGDSRRAYGKHYRFSQESL